RATAMEGDMGFLERIDPELVEGLAVWEALGFAEQNLVGDRIPALRAQAEVLMAMLVADVPVNDRVVREDRRIPGPRSEVPVRVYRPAGASGPLPCLVWI